MADEILKTDSKERVAFDLMTAIAKGQGGFKYSREETLLLYSQCLKAVSGDSIEEVLEDWRPKT